MDEPRRNDVFDRELRRALAAEAGAAAGPHVDAELAAAWIDRQLDPMAARSIEAHLAGCQTCQILMATLARLAPEEAPTAGGLAWWPRLRAGWLLPATVAAAAALVIWVAVPQQRRAASTPAEQLQARADRSVEAPPRSAEPPATPAPAPAAEAAASAARAPRADVSRRVAQQASQDAGAREALEKKEAEADTFAPAPSLERRERFAEAAPPPAAPAAAPAPSQPPPAPPAQAKAVQDSITVTGESPARPSERQDSANETRRGLAAVAGTVNRLQSVLVIAAPDGARWRRSGPALEFAPRGGAFTATTMPVAADAITAGAAPGGTVCWLAGVNGLVLVSENGVRFTRVAAPAAVNLVAVAAADARSAIVTAADGRRFRTTDQGASWSALP